MIDLKNKCGSCQHFEQNYLRFNGLCKAKKYDDTVAHDPERPYATVDRSKIRCKLYVAKVEGSE